MSADCAQPTPSEPHRTAPGQVIAVGVMAALALAIFLVRTDFHAMPREDIIECLTVAEEINAGRGITTRVISPSVLSYLADRGRAQPPWPNLLRSPLPCLMIAGLARVVPQPTAVALSSGIFFVLSVPLIFLIASRRSGAAAGWLVAVTYTVSRSGLWFAASGLNESSTIFALAGIVWCLMLPLGWAPCLAAGVLAGIGYLGRSTFTVWAIVIVAFIIWRSRGVGRARVLGRIAAFGVPLTIAVVWWGTAIGAMTGEFGASGQDDIIIRLDTDLYPGRSPALTLEHWRPLEFVRAYPGAIAGKYARIAQQTWPWLLDLGALPLLMAFFAVEFFLTLAGARRVEVHWLVYALIAVQALMVPLASEGHGGVGPNRYLDPFGPIAAALGAAFAVELLRHYEAPVRRALPGMALIVLLTAVPVLFNLVVGPYHQEALARTRVFGSSLAARAAPGDILATTDAALDGWTSGLHAVYLPVTPAEFARMDTLLPVEWVHVGEMSGGLAPRTDAWRPIIAGTEELPGFELVERLPDGSVLLRRAR